MCVTMAMPICQTATDQAECAEMEGEMWDLTHVCERRKENVSTLALVPGYSCFPSYRDWGSGFRGIKKPLWKHTCG